MTNAEVLARNLEGTRDWTLKLIADLDGDDWFFQPTPGMGHALWLCGHLAAAQNLLIHARCLGNSILADDFSQHFPIGAPVKSAGEHDYPPVEEVLSVMADIHSKTVAAIRGMSDAMLAEKAFGKDGTIHPHYQDKGGAVAHCDRHEAFHAGQIASIRRLLGKGYLR